MDEPRDDKSADSGARRITRRVPLITGSEVPARVHGTACASDFRFLGPFAARASLMRSVDSVHARKRASPMDLLVSYREKFARTEPSPPYSRTIVNI